MKAKTSQGSLSERYERRETLLYRMLKPPLPLIHNSTEKFLPATDGLKLYLGGAGSATPSGFINIDLLPYPGVDVAADVEHLPFPDAAVAAIECDAVLEHVENPERAVAEFSRVLRPGGFMHVVVPFCHPFHAYPSDYRRWTTEGLKILLHQFEVVEVGVRTGPTASILAFLLE